MNIPRFAVRHSRRIGPLGALAVALLATPCLAAALIEEAGLEAEAGAGGRWESYAVSSSRSRVSGEGEGLTVALAPGDQATFSRAAGTGPAPGAVLCTFNVAMPGAESDGAAQVLRMGWDFGTSNQDEPDARTYGALGLAGAGKGFRLRSIVGGEESAVFMGTQAISWALNNSGEAMSYDAPNGRVETVANDRMDVWVGSTRVFDDVLATNPEGRITDLKWCWSKGSGITAFDHFAIGALEPASDAPRAGAIELASAVSDAGPAVQSATVLNRAMPNPFTGVMRFAYAVQGASAAVDIGVFDVAGRRIRVLARGVQEAGEHEVRWDGRDEDGSQVQHGMYFLRASVGANRQTSRVMYLREGGR